MQESIYSTEEQFYYLTMKEKKLKSIYNKILKPVRYDFLESIKSKYDSMDITINKIEDLDKITGKADHEGINIKIQQGYIYEYMISKVKDSFLLSQITKTYKIKNIEEIFDEIQEHLIEVDVYLNPNKEIHNIINKEDVLDFRINQEQNTIYYEEISIAIKENVFSSKTLEIDKRIEKEMKIIEHKINRGLEKDSTSFDGLAYTDFIYRNLSVELNEEINRIIFFLKGLETLDLLQFKLIDFKKELKSKVLKKEMIKEPDKNDFMRKMLNETLTIKNILENGNSQQKDFIKDKYVEKITICTIKTGSTIGLKDYILKSINKLNKLTIDLKEEYEEIKSKSSSLKLLNYNEFKNEFEM